MRAFSYSSHDVGNKPSSSPGLSNSAVKGNQTSTQSFSNIFKYIKAYDIFLKLRPDKNVELIWHFKSLNAQSYSLVPLSHSPTHKWFMEIVNLIWVTPAGSKKTSLCFLQMTHKIWLHGLLLASCGAGILTGATFSSAKNRHCIKNRCATKHFVPHCPLQIHMFH